MGRMLGGSGAEGRERKGQGERGERRERDGDWQGGRQEQKREEKMKKCQYRLIKHMLHSVIFSKSILLIIFSK